MYKLLQQQTVQVKQNVKTRFNPLLAKPNNTRKFSSAVKTKDPLIWISSVLKMERPKVNAKKSKAPTNGNSSDLVR
jgi:hypothetical protein